MANFARRLFAIAVITAPVFAWADQKVESQLPVPEYSVRPDPRDCPYPECGGWLVYEINGMRPAPIKNLCTADLPFAGYVVRCMCHLEDGTLVEFYPSCYEPMVGTIEPDADYKSYYMFVYPTCEKIEPASKKFEPMTIEPSQSE